MAKLEDLLDQSLRDHAEELPMYRDLPVPDMQEALRDFRMAAGQRSGWRQRRTVMLRNAAAAALVLLIGVGAGIAAFRAGLLPVGGNLQAAGMHQQTMETLDMNMAQACANEVERFRNLKQASDIFTEIPILPDVYNEETEMLSFYTELEAPFIQTLKYDFDTDVENVSLEIYCAQMEASEITALETLIQDEKSKDLRYTLGNLGHESVLFTDEEGISHAVWVSCADQICYAQAAMPLEAMKPYLEKLVLYVE